jgi:indole-3-glycerol phosphate synthase
MAALRRPRARSAGRRSARVAVGGPIRPDADPAAIARDYEAGGAAAISVTDRLFFDGDPRPAAGARGIVAGLRKDFITDAYRRGTRPALMGKPPSSSRLPATSSPVHAAAR